MQVILLEKNKKLGDVGDVANVKNGFARNFLIPNKKAVQATKENLEIFQQRKSIIHKEIEEKKAQAEQVVDSINNKWVYILKQAGEDDRLYGSVTSAEIIKTIKEQLKEESLNKNSIKLLKPIKYLGACDIAVNIFADIYAKINVMVARTKEEAETEIKNALEGKIKKKDEVQGEMQGEMQGENLEISEEVEMSTDYSENLEQSQESKSTKASKEKSAALKKISAKSKSDSK